MGRQPPKENFVVKFQGKKCKSGSLVFDFFLKSSGWPTLVPNALCFFQAKQLVQIHTKDRMGIHKIHFTPVWSNRPSTTQKNRKIPNYRSTTRDHNFCSQLNLPACDTLLPTIETKSPNKRWATHLATLLLCLPGKNTAANLLIQAVLTCERKALHKASFQVDLQLFQMTNCSLGSFCGRRFRQIESETSDWLQLRIAPFSTNSTNTSTHTSCNVSSYFVKH